MSHAERLPFRRTLGVSPFDQVEVSYGAQIRFEPSDRHAALFEARRSAYLDAVLCEQSGPRIAVGRRKTGLINDLVFWRGAFKTAFRVTLYAPRLTQILVRYGARAEAAGLRQDRLSLCAESGGGLNLRGLDVGRLEVDAEWGCAVHLEGRCDLLRSDRAADTFPGLRVG